MLLRTALITGAGSGIGLRLAELLAARGDRLAVLDREFGDEALRRLRAAAGERLVTAEVDVRDGEQVAATVARCLTAGAPPRLVINSAGIQLAKPFGELTEEEFRRVVDVNLVGSRNVAAATWEHLDGGGRLVLIASLAGLVGNYGYAGYCASKYGVVGLAEVLRLEGRPRGIRVSCVCPPEVETPMVSEERRTMSEPTRALKAFAGTMELEPAAAAILKGIDRGDFLIRPGRARRTHLLGRLLPGRATHAISDRIVARALR